MPPLAYPSGRNQYAPENSNATIGHDWPLVKGGDLKAEGGKAESEQAVLEGCAWLAYSRAGFYGGGRFLVMADGLKVSRLRLRISAAAEGHVRGGHPWVFADSVREQNREGAMGELAVIYDRQDRFLAIGLFDPDSPIRLRVLHRGKPVTLDAAWWQAHLKTTLARRAGLFDEGTDGFRWIYGESDGWPGLVLDRYADTLVLKLYSAAWLARLEEIVALLRKELKFERLVLRLSRNIEARAESDFRARDGQMLVGEAPAGPVVFHETGIRFEADVLRGQKTGFFLDQRENRREIERLSRGAEVLNAFSFSGGFSLYAARGGARSVTNLDISAHALASAERNFKLNLGVPAIAACRREGIQADVFEWLAKDDRRKFDVVILDPPSLAKREAERAGALRAYGTLAEQGMARLRPGGVLFAASCSAHVSTEEFYEVVRRAARNSGRHHTELLTTQHPPDHPATFAEGQYLKGIYLRF